jgi:hypothetical protein
VAFNPGDVFGLEFWIVVEACYFIHKT